MFFKLILLHFADFNLKPTDGSNGIMKLMCHVSVKAENQTFYVELSLWISHEIYKFRFSRLFNAVTSFT